MVEPHLSSRLEQRDNLASAWVPTIDPIRFEVVANPASQPKIGFVACSTSAARKNMLDLQRSQNQMLRALAIATPISGCRADAIP
jgi:hypothetical protein